VAAHGSKKVEKRWRSSNTPVSAEALHSPRCGGHGGAADGDAMDGSATTLI